MAVDHGRAGGGNPRLCAPVRPGLTAMGLDLWLALIAALGCLFYLAAVLIRPEKF